MTKRALVNSPAQNQVSRIAITGVVNTPVVGTNTCSRKDFVVTDTTTDGGVQCKSTFTAGTVFGKSTAGSGIGVGSAVSMIF